MPSPDHSSLGASGGAGRELLGKFNVKVGQRIEVETTDGLVVTGLVIPRYERADSDYIVIKLKSGYNMGLKAGNIKRIKIIESQAPAPKVQSDSAAVSKKGMKNLLLLSTGGTIASRVDYRTGAVYPALSAQDLYLTIPELDEIANIEPEVVFSVYSENIGPNQWQSLSEKIVDQSKEKSPDGIVVMIGTDTLAYVAAALSFSTIGLDTPVVLVGAQRSTDRPSSDGALNLKAAATFAVDSKMPGVYVAMHENENDDNVAIHSGSRVRKNHTSRRDAFESIDIPLVARVRGNEIVMTHESEQKRRKSGDFNLKTRFDENVALVKSYPGFDQTLLPYLLRERNLKGLIIEGTGLGHVSSKTIDEIAELTRNGVFVGIASQCIWGRVDLNVYETGRDMINAGATPLENMIAETALAKLSWTIANFKNVSDVMLTDLVGEFTPRIPLKLG